MPLLACLILFFISSDKTLHQRINRQRQQSDHSAAVAANQGLPLRFPRRSSKHTAGESSGKATDNEAGTNRCGDIAESNGQRTCAGVQEREHPDDTAGRVRTRGTRNAPERERGCQKRRGWGGSTSPLRRMGRSSSSPRLLRLLRPQPRTRRVSLARSDGAM